MEGFKMILQVAILTVVFSLVQASPDTYGPPVYKHPPTPYHFNYHVDDAYKGANYAHQEKSDGKTVYGTYTVALPDGRKQTVEYTADHHRGFVAKVTYKGKAKHPQHYGPPITYSQPKYH